MIQFERLTICLFEKASVRTPTWEALYPDEIRVTHMKIIYKQTASDLIFEEKLELFPE